MAQKDQAGKGPLSADEASLAELRKSIEADAKTISDGDQPDEEIVEETEDTVEQVASESDEDVEDEGGVDEEIPLAVKPTAKPEDEWYIPGQFRTKDDFVKSYRELQAEYTRRTQELSHIKNAPIPEIKSQDPGVELADFAKRIETNPVKTLRELAREEARAESAHADAIRTKKDTFVNEYLTLKQNPEFAALEPEMCEIAAQYSDMFADQQLAMDPRLFHALFYMAKGVKQNQIITEEKKKSELKGEQKARKKQRVQVEGGSGSKGRTTKSVDDMSLDELRLEIGKGNLG